MARDFAAIVPRVRVTTPAVDIKGNPAPIEVTYRKLGHGAILLAAADYPGFREVVERLGSGARKDDVAKILAADDGGQAGAMALVLTELPGLIHDLLSRSVVLAPDEDPDEFSAWLLSLDADDLAPHLLAFVQVNFSRGMVPLLDAAEMMKAILPAKTPSNGTDATTKGVPARTATAGRTPAKRSGKR